MLQNTVEYNCKRGIMSSAGYNVLVPIILIVTVIVVAITTGVVASNQGPRAQATPPPTTTGSGATTAPVTSTQRAPTQIPATPPPSVIPACAAPNRVPSVYNHSLVLPQNATFSWNTLPMEMTQSFLNGVQISTDPVTSAVQQGERFLVAFPNDKILYKLNLDGMMLQPISAWQFENVFGFLIDNNYLYVLTDTNELLQLLIGETYAIIVKRMAVSEPAKFITVNPASGAHYALLNNGTIASLDLATAQVQSVCNPADLGYENIGFNHDNRLVGTVPFFIDIFPMGAVA